MPALAFVVSCTFIRQDSAFIPLHTVLTILMHGRDTFPKILVALIHSHGLGALRAIPDFVRILCGSRILQTYWKETLSHQSGMVFGMFFAGSKSQLR